MQGIHSDGSRPQSGLVSVLWSPASQLRGPHTADASLTHTRAGRGLTRPEPVSSLDVSSVPTAWAQGPCVSRARPVQGQGQVERSFSPTPQSPLSWVFLTPGRLGDEPEGLAGSSWIWGPPSQPSGMELPPRAPDGPVEATCAPSSAGTRGVSSALGDASELLFLWG